ncbi:DsbA family protein [Crystallibacter degradans]|uniref:DsbA family protein n=1 Tax=Crystallibacter degradans TaxID=2726743 RepID=UPI001474F4B2|nr:thioredoxin domain-containing protein [Arthrobacter sp. SF27]NMR31203.1 thioredoxin domain-containing protein [Arthrobacter sp. SF27]
MRTGTAGTDRTKKAKILAWSLLGLVVIGSIIGIFLMNNYLNGRTAPGDGGNVVRENSRVLSQAPDEKAVLVEFLDFECEPCLTAYPFVEELRADYGDKITFVHRYFPLPGHKNSMNAALSAEAAAQQGKYEQMYKKMFDTQTQWGESDDDQSSLFRSYAQELGLDMAAYDAAVADPATRERIEADKRDGQALGIAGAPTFYLDGKLLNPKTLDEFRDLVEAAATRP